MTRLLEGKVALVTGAGHGIGRGHAIELADHGATVVVNDLGSSVSGEGAGRDADEVVDIITARGGIAIADYGDVGDEQQVEAMVARAFDEFGRLDILVNNAGIVRDKAIWNMTVEDFDLVMRVHVRGTWLTSRAAARRWRELAKGNGGTVYGRIINTTSGAGLWGNFGQTNYATAKAAIVGLTQTLNLELAKIGVTVNALSPTGSTRLFGTISGDATAPESELESDERPDGAFDPNDPATSSPVVAWLAGPRAGHISGQVVRVIGDELSIMRSWTKHARIGNDQQRWDAVSLGPRAETDLFGTRASGIRPGA
ncbi:MULTISPECIES: SDR family NAD(P)-dependent oxidoreductase [Nocardia]|uniref:SDR family NAD(P)-dependent oxidoreductase n=1 Tax=Nocardia TaxID=1817 RepID=UPI000D687AF7|nr:MULTISPECIES: SDR family NAD(P)-dependent oxidoreductase [Nocardia]